MNEQISSYVDKMLSPYLFGYRKGRGTQHCLLAMIELWRKALDEKKVGGGGGNSHRFIQSFRLPKP